MQEYIAAKDILDDYDEEFEYADPPLKFLNIGSS